jgi:hypothetical protein
VPFQNHPLKALKNHLPKALRNLEQYLEVSTLQTKD